MKKLALNLNELRVESFDTSSPKSDVSGTVQANQMSYGTCAATCYTCAQSCNGLSCFSCPATCELSICYGQTGCGGYTCNTCPASCYGTCADHSCDPNYTCDAYCA